MNAKKGLKNIGKNIVKPVKQVEKMGEDVVKAVSSPFFSDKRKLTIGERTSDILAKWAGSWVFIILFFVFIGFWMATNGYFVLKFIMGGAFDDVYPFILLNLILSCLAAIQAPVILMSQNRSSQRDRVRAEYDYSVNRKAEKEIQEIKKQLNRIEDKFNGKRKKK
jgi:uncharacterized membrane protein